jgi:predicted Zn-dependent protease
MVNIAKRERPWLKICLIAILVMGMCAVGAYYGRHAWRHWRSEHFAKETRAYFEKGDHKSAVLALRRGFLVDQNSAACWKVLADMAEAAGQTDAIHARLRVVELESRSFDSVLACARTALLFGDPNTADDVLGKLKEDRRNDPRYYELCGKAAAALGKPAVAAQQFAAALVLEPKSEQRQLDAAAAALARGWLEDRAESRATLERLKAKPEMRAAALRALLKDSMTSGESEASLALARELTAQPDADFSDQITLLGLLRSGGKDEASTLFETLKKSARGVPSRISELVLWMNRTAQFRKVIEWSNDFSEQEWADARVCVTVGVAYLAALEWPALESFSKGGNWGYYEYLRLALYSRALREQGKFLDARMQWTAAAKAAAAVPHAIAELEKTVSDWGWNVEAEELLRAASRDPKDGIWASLELFPKLAAKKDTVGLWEVSSRLVELDPQNDAAANNLAMISLLLGKDVTHASEMAKNLYAKHRGEAKYVSTYAYSLHLRGQTDQAVRVMSALDPAVIDAADIATYFGIFLAAAGDTERAAKYLDLAKGADLLPEEQELVRKARVQLAEATTAKRDEAGNNPGTK